MSKQVRSLLMALGRISLFVILLVLPSLARLGFYYQWPHAAPDVPRPDLSEVDVLEREVVAFLDAEAQQGAGRVLIDRAHDNAVGDTELNVLLSRLTARGLEAVSLSADDDLSSALRTAVGLVVVSPHDPYTAREIRAVERFVEQGGRVFLATDPSRYAIEAELHDLYGEIWVTESDVAAMNGLASTFGLAFADDYLYNTAENGGNYQYVILRDFAESVVTAGLEQVIFYAAHSLATSEEPLITVDEQTVSSLSEQRGGLATMGLGGGGRVLAVSDFTFMTEPYNAVADNNRLVANVADFLAGATRTFGLTEFPHFFGDDVDLVSVLVERDDIARPIGAVGAASSLQAALNVADKTLHWRTEAVDAHDVIYLGLYGGIEFWPEVGEILVGEGISFTLDTVEKELADLTPTPTPRFTPTPTPTPETSPTPTPTPQPLRDWVHLPGFGRVDAKETALFYHNEIDGRQVLIVLSFSETGLRGATDRLLWGDYTGCLIDEDRNADPDAIGFALCPTAYEPSAVEPTPVATPTPAPENGLEATPTPTPAALGSVLIVSDDDDEGTYDWWTSAYYFYDIVVNAGYEPLIWSTGFDGEITSDLVQSHDAVLWCSGDYQSEEGNPSEEELEILGEYLDQGGGLLLIGAFVGEAEDRERGLLLDIQVAQADHPFSEGFDADQVITLERFLAEEDYETYVMTDVDPDALVWARGPESEFGGEAVIAAIEDEFTGGRLALMGVPLYLLPYDDGELLGSNIVLWLLWAE
jgi:hypothetical protein